MSDFPSDVIDDLFDEAIEGFPVEQQEAARERLIQWRAALKLIREIETKGLEALL